MRRTDAEPITAKELDRARERASRKLECIISQYGDDGGERLSPQYFAQLIAEAIAAERCSKHYASLYEEKRRTARAEAHGNPSESNLIIA